MDDRTVNLEMPFIMPSQAQKHVTHNEALLQLDAVVHLSIAGEWTSPPPEPLPGSRILVAANATGAWAGRAGRIAIWQDGYWTFAAPRAGWLAWFEEAGRLKIFDGDTWIDTPLPDHAGVATLGVSATADATNRIAVSSPASLFSHDGGGHQLKVNKASANDTATLLFQSNWTGHAEMGLAGNNDFAIKVSNGAEWKTGLAIDGAGRVAWPNQPAVRVFRNGTSFSPTAGQQSGFTDFGLNRGGFALGPAAAAGGNSLLVPAGGTYLLALTVSVTTSTAYGVTVLRNGGQAILALNAPAAGAATLSGNGIFALEAGDALTFSHSGTATIASGSSKTILSLAMI
jgi:hypothetical protein